MADDEEAAEADWFERALSDEDDTEAGSLGEESQEGDDLEASPSEADQLGEKTESSDPADDPFAEKAESADAADDTFAEKAESSDEAEDPFGEDAEPMDIDLDEGESFGFDSGSGDTSFEEEEYRSTIPRLEVGIEGLDEMIQEGVPERSLIAVIGGAGTGKTTFALQFLQRALAADEKGVFITLEESRERIFKSAKQKGWDFEAASERGDLAVLDLDPVEMANSLTSIRSELPRLVGNYDADRLVLDSVSLLEMMYDDQATRRTEIYDFARALKSAGVTTLVTSEAAETTAYASRFGIIEYLTDAVFVLQYVRPEDFQETRLAIEIQKIRDANHSRETKPYEITNSGLSVYDDATIF